MKYSNRSSDCTGLSSPPITSTSEIKKRRNRMEFLLDEDEQMVVIVPSKTESQYDS
jgi:hypothetical protein